VFKKRGRGIIPDRTGFGGILYLMREGVTWGWRQLHNEELHYFYSTPDNVAAIN
jgi:hypothetical protein